MVESIEEQKDKLIREIERGVSETANYLGFSTLSPGVLAAMRAVPRHEFVPVREREAAYENRPLPIGHGQTISQPYIVAIMTEMLRLSPDSAVLEVGTGCGYQTAVLAALCRTVYSVEIVASLSDGASERLSRLGVTNVHFMHADGHLGWAAAAPYDSLIVTAAAAKVPPALVHQLKPGGRMVIPVGRPHMSQSIVLIEKNTDGAVSERSCLPVAFVPLVGS